MLWATFFDREDSLKNSKLFINIKLVCDSLGEPFDLTFLTQVLFRGFYCSRGHHWPFLKLTWTSKDRWRIYQPNFLTRCFRHLKWNKITYYFSYFRIVKRPNIFWRSSLFCDILAFMSDTGRVPLIFAEYKSSFFWYSRCQLKRQSELAWSFSSLKNAIFGFLLLASVPDFKLIRGKYITEKASKIWHVDNI